ncbi:reverse transcriptase [Senna tora]|uniref:Reverse transcriptase n=1 Tax=Senna tora TaxID=362788 RepID=A0A834STW5_9FABA|nr:reverse transcriptase [Senna tora]
MLQSNWLPESIEHIFKSCSISVRIWDLALPHLNVIHDDNFFSWIRKNSSANSQVQLGIPHGNLFINILHQIWLSRNNLVFSSKDINVNSCFRFALMRAAKFSHLTVNDNNNDVFKAPVLVSWISPPTGWWNIDGSCTSLSNNIAAGVIIRDYCGNWVLGFSKFLGGGTILCAEL